MKTNPIIGHGAACATAIVWGTTFISTKVLLRSFLPVEILFFRFVIGFLALCIACPRRLPVEKSREPYFMAAGLCGVTLYFLLENIALTYTLASNVGVIVSVAPFFTALCDHIFLKGPRPGPRFFAGFAVAMAGIALLSLPGNQLALNPIGDVLAFLAAVVWALYSTLTKKISGFGYGTIPATRRTFFYGLIFMLPALPLLGFRVEPARFAVPENLLNILFLGFGASALCFVTWNFAVRLLGPVKTSVYIYLVPVITVVTSALILGEPVTVLSMAGMALTVAGLFLSESKARVRIPQNR